MGTVFPILDQWNVRKWKVSRHF